VSADDDRPEHPARPTEATVPEAGDPTRDSTDERTTPGDGEATSSTDREAPLHPGEGRPLGGGFSSETPSADDWKEQAAQAGSVFNFVYGGVHAKSANFGSAGDAEHGARGRATGRLTPAEVAAATAGYLRSPSFYDARRRLTEKKVVLLLGPDDTGKRATAITLLHSLVGASPISAISPSYTLQELQAVNFRKGRGYFVQDRALEGGHGATRAFELDQLRAKVESAEAYLVITGSAAGPEHRARPALRVMWSGPDPVELFNAEIARHETIAGLSEKQLEKLRECAKSRRTPGAIRAFARQVAEDPDHAMEDTAQQQISQWFDKTPGRDRLLFVAALAFAHGLPLREFERHHAMLVELAKPPEDEKPADTPQSDRFTAQTRRQWSEDLTVLRSVSTSAGEIGERGLEFREESYRRHVLTELHRSYGWDFWSPVRAWVREIGCNAPFGELNVQVAYGVAEIARQSVPEVREDYLEIWAAGRVAERQTAASVLWWMSSDHGLAPLALQMARRWTDGAGPSRAMTAALALSGELGVRYPEESMRLLWHLAMRGEVIHQVAAAAVSMRLLYALDTDQSVSDVLRHLYAHAQRLASGPAVQRRKMRNVVLGVLNTTRETEEPVAAEILRTQPKHGRRLGALWGLLLQSNEYQREGLRALVITLRAIHTHGGALEATAELGRGLAKELTAARQEALAPAFQRALTDPSELDLPRDMLAALLDALRGPHT